MKTEGVCKECKEVHHLPTYDNICQYYQKGKPENEMTETKGHVTICLECKIKNSKRSIAKAIVIQEVNHLK